MNTMKTFTQIDEIETPNKQLAAKKSTLVSVFVNSILSFIQVVVGFLAGSQGLIADGIHSLTDLFSDFIVLLANHYGNKEADDSHHYGHHKYETAASLFIGISLLLVGIGMLWSAGHKILYPLAMGQIQTIALWVAIFALISKELLFRYMLTVAKKVRSSMLIANAWHARSDAASSLIVTLGIIGALLGYPILDVIGALIVGLMIIKTGWKFSWDAFHDLMDKSASKEEHEKIAAIIRATKGVKGLHDLRTRRMGDMILVDVHIEVDGKLSVEKGHQISLDARNRVMKALPVLNLMTHLDPV